MSDLDALSVRSVFKLFDCPILSVVSYGCQVWFQNSQFVRSIIGGNEGKIFIRKMVNNPLEKLHLKFLE